MNFLSSTLIQKLGKLRSSNTKVELARKKDVNDHVFRKWI